MYKIFFFFTIVILLAGSASALFINEIMYDPVQNDNFNEWIELYNPSNNNVSLEGWFLCGVKIFPGYVDHNDGSVKNENGYHVPPDGYVLITDGGSGTDSYENFGVGTSSLAFHGNASTLCNGSLTNAQGKTITLEDSERKTDDEVLYNPRLGGNGNNKSLERLANGSWVESIADGGTPGAANSAPCTPLLVNSTWSEWEINTICLLNDTYLRQRTLVQYDIHFCIENETISDTQAEGCDFCLPSWRAVNTSCREDDSLLQSHNDSKGCYGLTSLESDLEGREENVTYALSCDFNDDGIIGSAADINFSLAGLEVTRANDTINFTMNGSPLLWFSFPGQTFLLSGIFLERQSKGSGYVLINGISAEKTIYLERNTSSNAVCIKDAEVFSAGNISVSCTAQNETIVRCDGNPSGNQNYTCRLENSTYIVSGVQHSGITEFTIPDPEPEPAPPSGGDGGGGSSRRDEAVEQTEETLETEAAEASAEEAAPEEQESEIQEGPADGTVERVFEIDFDGAAAVSGATPAEEAADGAGNALTGAVIGVLGENSVMYAAVLGIFAVVLAGAVLIRRNVMRKMKRS